VGHGMPRNGGQLGGGARLSGRHTRRHGGAIEIHDDVACTSRGAVPVLDWGKNLIGGPVREREGGWRVDQQRARVSGSVCGFVGPTRNGNEMDYH
jgi:hypothetical protein